ncbi:MAG: hypothetical protein HQL69_23745 [Magnetococcales bacterium]|nr:hypothetical protein [Magnetococcales bacterium]
MSNSNESTDLIMEKVFDEINLILKKHGFDEVVEEIRLVSIKENENAMQKIRDENKYCGLCCRTTSSGRRVCSRCCYA